MIVEPLCKSNFIYLFVKDISDISAISSTFTVDFWVSAIWLDTRLKFSHIDPCRRNLSLDHDMEPKLWSPNVCIVNSKNTHVHESPKPNILLMVGDSHVLIELKIFRFSYFQTGLPGLLTKKYSL